MRVTRQAICNLVTSRLRFRDKYANLWATNHIYAFGPAGVRVAAPWYLGPTPSHQLTLHPPAGAGASLAEPGLSYAPALGSSSLDGPATPAQADNPVAKSPSRSAGRPAKPSVPLTSLLSGGSIFAPRTGAGAPWVSRPGSGFGPSQARSTQSVARGCGWDRPARYPWETTLRRQRAKHRWRSRARAVRSGTQATPVSLMRSKASVGGGPENG